MPVLPEQRAVGGTMSVASPGMVPGVTVNVSGTPAPHPLYPVTMSVPTPVPTTGVMEEDELEPDHPVPETVHE